MQSNYQSYNSIIKYGKESNSFKGNNLTVQFKTGLLCLISNKHNKPVRSLKLLVSEAKISKWSKLIVQLHYNRWSENADPFTILSHFHISYTFWKEYWCLDML